MGVPAVLAASTIGFRAFGSAATLPFRSDFREIACPLRLTIHGTIMGFFGEPSSPIVEAIGIPISMCVH